jgi:hypothetical protein
MKNMLRLGVTVCLLLAAARPSGAQVIDTILQFVSNCGNVSTSTQIWQNYNGPVPQPSLTTFSTTQQEINSCGFSSKVRSWMSYPQGPATESVTYPTAQYRKYNVSVPYHHMARAEASHAVVKLGRDFSFGNTLEQEIMQAPPSPSQVGSNQEECEYWGYVWTWASHGGMCDGNPYSPIIMDVAHNGIKLTSLAHGVVFDLNADGSPEQVPWTRRHSDDAFLAIDLNGNGTIDNGGELFGNFSPSTVPGINAANGFEALKRLQDQTSPTETLTPADPGWAALLVWTDRNHNGYSEPDELATSTAAGLEWISLRYKESRRRDRHGNEFRQKGRAGFTGGITDAVWDVWFRGEVEADDEPTTP